MTEVKRYGTLMNKQVRALVVFGVTKIVVTDVTEILVRGARGMLMTELEAVIITEGKRKWCCKMYIDDLG